MRSERLAQQTQMYEKQQTQVAHLTAFVERFRAKASKAKQAQSRLKALERSPTAHREAETAKAHRG